MQFRLATALIMIAVSIGWPIAMPAGAKDLSKQCGAWKFDAEGGEEGEPSAHLDCAGGRGLAVQCAGSFIGNLRYYGEAPGDGYRLFRFKIGAQSFDMWLRLEEMDAASAGYQEFEHPLFKALAANGSVTVTDVAGQKTDILPLKGFSAALASLMKKCDSTD